MAAGGPLEGLFVVEVANWIAAPCCGALLADLGATVVKVEARTGDSMRCVHLVLRQYTSCTALGWLWVSGHAWCMISCRLAGLPVVEQRDEKWRSRIDRWAPQLASLLQVVDLSLSESTLPVPRLTQSVAVPPCRYVLRNPRTNDGSKLGDMIDVPFQVSIFHTSSCTHN